MYRVLSVLFVFLTLGCQSVKEPAPDVQIIVDRAIEAAGGDRYLNSTIQFKFRDRTYRSFRESGRRILLRQLQTDTAMVEDRLKGNSFERRINEVLQDLPDSTKLKYAESVNSVHYFAYLPKGLNDAAVNKTYLGKVSLGDSEYHKVQITFDQEGGGTDYEDVFVYWFNTQTHLPDFLAYEYHTNGGGKRFREALNERRVEGIRFVDYKNFKYEGSLPVSELDSLYELGDLELLSLIELSEIEVIPDNYN